MTTKSKGRKWRLVAGAAIIALLVVFFMAPVFSYESAHYEVAGGTYNFWTSRVSTSYMVLGCGLLLGTNMTENVIGNGSWWFSQMMPSPMFACDYHPTEIIGQAGGMDFYPSGETLTVKTDWPTYTGSEPIVCSGTVTPPGKGWLVTIWIINPAGVPVNSLITNTDPLSGAYSLTMPSGGTARWITGTYTVKAELTMGGYPIEAVVTSQFNYTAPT